MAETMMTAGWLLAASVFDIRRRRVPIWLLLLGGLAVIPAAIWRCGSRPEEYWEVLKGCIPGIVLLAMAGATRKAGVADGIALLYMGVLLEKGCLLIFVISLLLISFYSGFLLVLRRAERNTELPYLPFLSAAWILERLLGG